MARCSRRACSSRHFHVAWPGSRIVCPGIALPGYRSPTPQRAQVHGTSHYANVVPADTLAEEVCGTLLEIKDEELDVVDGYERLDGYRRILVTAASGRRAWLYVFDAALSASRSSEA
jgi:gamma-glutamylcyclotransferase (GGCT)/AIG2-like uncharacterized protein YtfP